VRRARYPRIFLNYRRADSEAFVGRLHEGLVRIYGEGDVFMDQFSIQPGELFAWTVQQAVVHSSVMISVIGPNWMPPTEPYGIGRTYKEPRDYQVDGSGSAGAFAAHLPS
jgi:hypothetical protein